MNGKNTDLGKLNASIKVSSAAVVHVVVSEVMEDRLCGNFLTKFVDVYFHPEMEDEPTEDQEEAMSFRVFYADKDDKKKINRQFKEAIKAVEKYIGEFYEEPNADVTVEFASGHKLNVLQDIINAVENTFDSQEA